MGLSGTFEVAHASLERLCSVRNRTQSIVRARLTVQSRVHPAYIDQQTDHSHVESLRPLSQELVLQNLATFAALGHRIQVDIGERMAEAAIAPLVKHPLVIFKNSLEKVILYVFPPERDAILFLEVSNLVS